MPLSANRILISDVPVRPDQAGWRSQPLRPQLQSKTGVWTRILEKRTGPTAFAVAFYRASAFGTITRTTEFRRSRPVTTDGAYIEIWIFPRGPERNRRQLRSEKTSQNFTRPSVSRQSIVLSVCWELCAAMSPPTARTQQGNAASQTPGPPQYAKVFVQRDYSNGTAVKFMTNFPQGLENKVSLFFFFFFIRIAFFAPLAGDWERLSFLFCRTQIERSVFEYTVNQLNTYFAEAEKASCKTYCEGCFACFTVYTMFFCADTHYEKVNM